VNLRDTITKLRAREILSGTGRPTVAVTLETNRGISVEASVASGTSKGAYEAFELHDGETRFQGYGVRRAVENVNRIIAPAIRGLEVSPQAAIDRILIELDGTPQKTRLGGNAILPVSVACAKAGARTTGAPIYRYLEILSPLHLPSPLATILAGGKHSPSSLEFEDYLLIPGGFSSFSKAVEALHDIRKTMAEILEARFGPVPETGGAFAPPLRDTSEAFDLMLRAVENAGHEGNVFLGLDVAASELYRKEEDLYSLSGKKMTAEELTDYYRSLTKRYPLAYIEDPFQEDDYRNFASLTSLRPGEKIVGDDLFASHPGRIARGISEGAGNTILLKINQIGTVSEALEAAKSAHRGRFGVTVSVRSNETNDSFVADFAVAAGAQQIKLGCPVRGERISKFNRLLEIEEELEGKTD
jgi:enolase